MSVVPKFFVVHQLPDGTSRHAYHRDTLPHARNAPQYGRDEPANGWTWEGVADEHADPTAVEWSGDWLLAERLLAGYRVTRPGTRSRDGWAKRDQPHWGDFPVPDDRLWDDHGVLPDQPAQSAVEHHAEHDAAHACWECKAFEAHYCPRYVLGPPVEEVGNLTGHQLMPGDLPPVIDRDQLAHPPGQVKSKGLFSGSEVKDDEMVWIVDHPSTLAVYGRGLAHLLPGKLTGLRSAVGVVLAQHPLVGNFYDWHDSRQSNVPDGFSVTVQVPWETPRTMTKYEKPTPRSRKKTARQVPVWAIEEKVAHRVPNELAAASLAEALADWDSAVQDQVRRFFPYGEKVSACDHCSGRGWHGTAEESR